MHWKRCKMNRLLHRFPMRQPVPPAPIGANENQRKNGLALTRAVDSGCAVTAFLNSEPALYVSPIGWVNMNMQKTGTCQVLV